MPVTRIFEHYGPNPPDPRWPTGARLALNFVINHEEGGEESFPDGDPRSETGLTEGSTAAVKGRDLAAESMFQYGSRVGFWRLHRLFTERNLPCTVFAVARALERTPQCVAAIKAAGWDVAAHGWKWEMHAGMDEATERQRIADATAIITREIGVAPLGWYTRYAPSENTRRLLIERGYLYDSDAYDDELPHYVPVGCAPHLVIPYTLDANDMKFCVPPGFAGHEAFEAYLRDGLDQLRAEPHATMMSIGLHCRLVGRPARAAALRRFLDHAASCPDVWIATREEIARHWLATHPPAG